jgi:PAS domain S-box-containing protein
LFGKEAGMSIVLSRSLPAQLGIAFLAVAAASATALALDERSLVLPFAFAVVIAACVGRRRLGIFTTLLSAISIALISHHPDLPGDLLGDFLDTGIFLAVGLFISMVIDRLSREIEREREIHERVRGSEEKLRLLVDSVHDYALCLLDADGHIAGWNSGAERMFGYRRDDITGRHICCLYTDAATLAGEPLQELELAQAAGRCERREWQLRRDGSRLRTHMVLTAIHDGAGQLRGYAVVLRELIPAATAQSLTGLLDEHRRGLELAIANRT